MLHGSIFNGRLCTIKNTYSTGPFFFFFFLYVLCKKRAIHKVGIACWAVVLVCNKLGKDHDICMC